MLHLKKLKIYHGKSESNRVIIHSIDFKPYSDIIATTGQDNVIKVWKMRKYYCLKDDKINLEEYNVLQLYEFLEIQKKVTNILRWSLDGKYLALGTNDGNLFIAIMNKNFKKNKLKIVKYYNAHFSDIIDLNWSFDSSFIATGSLDAIVHIWSLEKRNPIVKLFGHSSWVRGVNWDPLGKYICTHSSDKMLVFWKLNNWNSFKILIYKSKKYKKLGSHNRSIWSSCGKYFWILDCIKKKKKILFRVLDMKRSFDFKFNICINVEKMSTIKGSPKIFFDLYKRKFFTLLVLGTRKGSLIFFRSDSPSSVIKIKNFSKQTITEISWNSNGLIAYFSLVNGCVYSVNIKKKFFKILYMINQEKIFNLIRNYNEIYRTPDYLRSNFKLIHSIKKKILYLDLNYSYNQIPKIYNKSNDFGEKLCRKYISFLIPIQIYCKDIKFYLLKLRFTNIIFFIRKNEKNLLICLKNQIFLALVLKMYNYIVFINTKKQINYFKRETCSLKLLFDYYISCNTRIFASIHLFISSGLVFILSVD
mmetsp:Transcript_20217/g.67534  ORF Transcript_20217/g.67534 Transcript_20217/m.67534 type:complete len:531 (-) Transcript_20217:691-2283(-)